MRAPELRFRLPGRWFSVDLSSVEATTVSIRRIAKESVGGPADDRAPERARVRQQLQDAVAAGSRGDIRAIMFSTEIALGTPLPVTLLVFQPGDLRMSPAIGTAPDAVLAVMAESLKELDPVAHVSMAEVRGPGVPALRTHRTEAVTDGSEADGATRLIADYWVPVPETKQVLLARFSTPIGELENMMCALFDEFVAAAFFASERPPSLREQLLAAKR